MKGIACVLIIFTIISGLIAVCFVYTVPAYEDKCKLYIENKHNIDITDSVFASEQISCQNYFDGHYIAEYWSWYIAIEAVLIIVLLVIIFALVVG